MASRRPLVGQALAVSLLLVVTATAATATPAMAAPATGQVRLAGTATAVPGSYIVVLTDATVREGLTPTSLARTYGGQGGQRCGAALHGFEAGMSEAAAKRFAADRRVAFVEQNQFVSLLTTQSNAT